jgi:hypothetical protein
MVEQGAQFVFANDARILTRGVEHHRDNLYRRQTQTKRQAIISEHGESRSTGHGHEGADKKNSRTETLAHQPPTGTKKKNMHQKTGGPYTSRG